MSVQVPLAAVPSQTESITLGGQQCQIAVRLLGDTLYFSLSINNTPILVNHACRNRTRMLLAQQYSGFQGDFVFVDTQGDHEPEFTGLGGRYVLLYLTQAELNV